MEFLKELLIAIEPGLKMVLIALFTYLFAKGREYLLVKIEKIKSENTAKYLNELNALISDVVAYVNQTYVTDLKDTNLFDASAQLQALQKAKVQIVRLASDRMKNAVENVHQDLNDYITTQIEKSVARLK